jgi:hypothetical protein
LDQQTPENDSLKKKKNKVIKIFYMKALSRTWVVALWDSREPSYGEEN